MASRTNIGARGLVAAGIITWLVAAGCSTGGIDGERVTDGTTPCGATLSLTAPIDGATVHGTVTLAAHAASTISWVNFYVDGAYLASSPPASTSWDTTAVADGAHVVSVKGFAAGSTAALATASVRVTVANTVAPAPDAGPPDAPADAPPSAGPIPACESVPPNPAGTDYFVDASLGDDGATGTSPARAWKTLAHVNGHAFSAGDVVYLRAGGMWRETLAAGGDGRGSNFRGVTFTACGAGALPTLTGADPLTTPWSKSSSVGGLDVYTTRPGDGDVGGLYDDQDDDGWSFTRVHALADLASKQSSGVPGTFYWDDAAKVLSVQLADGSDPAKHGRWEIAVRAAGFRARPSGTSSDDVHLSYLRLQRFGDGATSGGRCAEGAGGRAIDLTNWNANVGCCAPVAPLDCDGSSGAADLGTGTGVQGFVVDHCVVTQTSSRMDHATDSAFDCYDSGIFVVGADTPRIRHNVVSYTGGHGNGIQIHACKGGHVFANDVSHWNHNGIDTKFSDGVWVDYNVTHDQPDGGAGVYQECSRNYVVEYNVAYSVANGVQLSITNDSKGEPIASVFNNTIVTSGTAIYVDHDQHGGDDVYLGNNLVYLTGAWAEYVHVEVDFGGLQYAVHATHDDWFGGTASAFHNFAPGATELYLDPLLVDLATHDLHLKSGSPLIDRGTTGEGWRADATPPYVGAAPDIGAFELGGAP